VKLDYNTTRQYFEKQKIVVDYV